jgi:RNA recognition motif-containing protein
MNIYVGNISRTATEQDLKDAFSAFGEVSVRDGTGQFYALSERVSRGRKSKSLSN